MRTPISHPPHEPGRDAVHTHPRCPAVIDHGPCVCTQPYSAPGFDPRTIAPAGCSGQGASEAVGVTVDGIPDRRAARAALTEAGVDYAAVKAWAVASGRWTEAELTALNVDAVEAYLAERARA